jgi:hypothetical protein
MLTESLNISHSCFTEGESSSISCIDNEELDSEALGEEGIEGLCLKNPRAPPVGTFTWGLSGSREGLRLLW